MWFHKKDIKKYNTIKIDGLRGYVLPHAGTKYTGEIISHTLQFKPSVKIKKIYIIYYPSTDIPDINDMYHEYYVPHECLKLFYDVEYHGINLKKEKPKLKIKKDELIIVSADFSHFLPLEESVNLENKAAHSLMFRKLDNTEYNSIIDNKISFEYLYNNISKNIGLQWVGRDRSKGKNGVGYLSFLIREKNSKSNIKGIVMTSYDLNMNEMGKSVKFFTNKDKYSPQKEYKIRKELQVNKYYSVTYFYLSKSLKDIKGYTFKENSVFPIYYLENILTSDVTLGISNKKKNDKKSKKKSKTKIYDTHTIYKSIKE